MHGRIWAKSATSPGNISGRAGTKTTVLTASEFVTRTQIVRTLSDIFTAIAVTLGREGFLQEPLPVQQNLICRALTEQRTWLILDSFETVDDDQFLASIREFPLPSKCIVTTRHHIDSLHRIPLAELPRDDALEFVHHECLKKNVTLANDEADLLVKRTGGVPLAIVWSIAQVGMGHSIERVLRRLGDTTGEVVTFCFAEALARSQNKPAHRWLMALAICPIDASREALGRIADVSLADRDDGLVELEGLSLVSKRGNRFSFLSLTRTFALAELESHPDMETELRRHWIDCLKEITNLVRAFRHGIRQN